MQRWIMHIDMDAFFASVEELDAPELRGKPVIVGGGAGDGSHDDAGNGINGNAGASKSTDKGAGKEHESAYSGRGVVCAASYAARAFGVHSAMPLWQARQKCPQGIFVPTRKWRYAEVSREVMAVFGDFSPVVEQASVDEAYVDATGLERVFGPVEEMAMALKDAVKTRTGLTCSVGLAPVKFVAKIASDMRKPNGFFMVRDEELVDFLGELPVGKIPGVGKKMRGALDLLGVHKVGDVRNLSKDFWERRFGKGGVVLWERSWGIDTREVEPFTPPKSESAENTFAKNTKDIGVLRRWLLLQSERVGASLRRHGLTGRTITLKVKFADFRQVTRSHTMDARTNTSQVIFEEAMALLEALPLRDAVRLIGVGVSGLEDAKMGHDAGTHETTSLSQRQEQQEQATQLLLPIDLGASGAKTPCAQVKKEAEILQEKAKKAQAKQVKQENAARRAKLDVTLDALRERYGNGAVRRGDLLGFDED